MAKGRTGVARQRHNQPMDQSLDKAQLLQRNLATMVRECYAEKFGSLPETPLELDLKFHIDPKDGWRLTFDPPLEEQLYPQLEQAEAQRDIYRSGQVYCFRCRTSECEHSLPSGYSQVFSGFDELGCPQWCELSQWLIDARDERIDRLYGTQRSIVATIMRGRDLRARQLAPFGRSSKTYSLLGQVVAGYFRPPEHAGGDENGKLALTFQAVEGRDREGRLALELNTVCANHARWTLQELLGDAYEWVDRARQATRGALKKLQEEVVRPGGGGRNAMKRVPDLLRKLAAELERGQRASKRQTRHAKERRQIQRPVDKAMADLREARPERMFLDAKTQAIVLYADKGRCHVFNEAGRHVTSFVIQPDAVRLRLKKRRWTALEPHQLHEFMEIVSGL